MSSTNDPSVHCDCRAISVRNAIVISLVVGACAALLRSLAFAGQPLVQAACGVVVGLAIVTYGIARLYDLDSRLPKALYVVVIAVGILITGLWAAALF